MPRTLKALVVVLLVALLPLRAVAAVTIGLCAIGQQGSLAAVLSGAGEIAAHHGCEEQPAKSSPDSCGVCIEHCSSAAFAPSVARCVTAPAIAETGSTPVERIAPAFFPEQLDRPPLA